jgi:hypothetical protein
MTRQNEERRHDDALKRTPATPDVKLPLTKEASKEKGDDEVVTRRRPAKNKKLTSSSKA